MRPLVLSYKIQSVLLDFRKKNTGKKRVKNGEISGKCRGNVGEISGKKRGEIYPSKTSLKFKEIHRNTVKIYNSASDEFQNVQRDCYPEGTSLTLKAAKYILLHISSICEQLHSKQLTHGDLYAHNILANDKDHLYLTDFGAAWDYSALEPPAKHRIQALEVCAFGWLVGELQSLINPPNKEMDPLFMRCTLPDLTSRPTFSEIVQLLSV